MEFTKVLTDTESEVVILCLRFCAIGSISEYLLGQTVTKITFDSYFILLCTFCVSEICVRHIFFRKRNLKLSVKFLEPPKETLH